MNSGYKLQDCLASPDSSINPASPIVLASLFCESFYSKNSSAITSHVHNVIVNDFVISDALFSLSRNEILQIVHLLVEFESSRPGLLLRVF